MTSYTLSTLTYTFQLLSFPNTYYTLTTTVTYTTAALGTYTYADASDLGNLPTTNCPGSGVLITPATIRDQ